jgi:FXSXX-COOH protein
MPRKLGLPARSAAAVPLAALAGGDAAAAAAAPALPDLSAAPLASVHAHANPVLSAAISRVLADHAGNMSPDVAASFQA